MVVDLAISIEICLLDDVVPDLLVIICCLSGSENCHELSLVNLAISIHIESLECLVQILLAQSLLSIECGSNELLVINDSIIIKVNLPDHVHEL